MANLWSHYLSNGRCPPQPSNFIYVVQQMTGICSLLGKESVLAADVSETSAKDRLMFVPQQVQNWRSFLFVQGHVHYREMSYFLYFSSKTEMVLLSGQ